MPPAICLRSTRIGIRSSSPIGIRLQFEAQRHKRIARATLLKLQPRGFPLGRAAAFQGDSRPVSLFRQHAERCLRDRPVPAAGKLLGSPLSEAPSRLFNANTLVRVERADSFINRREHLRCFFYFQSGIDLDQSAEDGLPFARIEAGQFLKDFPYAHRSRLRQSVRGGNDRFVRNYASSADSLLSWALDVERWTFRHVSAVLLSTLGPKEDL